MFSGADMRTKGQMIYMPWAICENGNDSWLELGRGKELNLVHKTEIPINSLKNSQNRNTKIVNQCENTYFFDRDWRRTRRSLSDS